MVEVRQRGRLRSPPLTPAEVPLSQTGFIDHIGIGVPDLVSASGSTTTSWTYSGSASGSRQAPKDHSTTGLTVLWVHSCSSTKQRNREPTHAAKRAFITSPLVASRSVVRDAHQWARARDAVILDEPGEFPQYGEHCFATYWLDPHGFKLEAVCHSPEES